MIGLECQPLQCHISSMAKTPKRPRDPNQLAKLIVDIATSETSVVLEISPSRSELAQKAARSRAVKLAPKERSRIAKQAANARWSKVRERAAEKE